MLEKAAALKRFEYSPLDKELKAHTSTAEKKYQKLGKVFESNKTEEKIKKVVLSQIWSVIKIWPLTNTKTMNLLTLFFFKTDGFKLV